jgi:hypothetical protein
MQSFVELVRDLPIFVVAMFALLIALIIIVSMMPDDNPVETRPFGVELPRGSNRRCWSSRHSHRTNPRP